MKEVWPVIRALCALCDIYNCDETGLFFRGLPNKGYVIGDTKPCGGKVAKDRITGKFSF